MTAKKDGAGGRTTAPPSKWNLLFLGFFVLAGTACTLSVLTGTMVVPSMHETHDMHPRRQHPSFHAPVLIKKHNKDHEAQFEKAYHAVTHNIDKITKESQKYHMVFSTSCSPFQNWQSLAFFYFAQKVRQPGTVTRLVSGCTDEQEKELRKVHKERVVPLQIHGLQTFEMHVTPSFDDSRGGDQKYFNKPNGLLHWMQESLGFDGTSDHEDDDAIIIIVDPDMMLLRPITEDFSSKNYNRGWVDTQNTRKHHADGHDLVDYKSDIVTHGRPHAQKYGYGDAWVDGLKGHMEEVVGPDSPALKVSNQDAHDYYPAGPPYVATAKDMYQIAVHWVKFLPKYHEFFQGMMCEMHSYSLAAAHLQLPHKLAEGFMVSDYEADENWSFITDHMTTDNVCMDPPNLAPKSDYRPFDPSDSTSMTDAAYEVHLGIPIKDLPYVLHYCQRYAMGRYFFSKYKLRENMFDKCEGNIMIEPPRDVASIYDWNMFPNGIEHWDFKPDPNSEDLGNERLKQRVRLINGWMLCVVVYGMNEAIIHYKKAKCGNDEKFFQKTYHFHDEKNFTDSLKDPSNIFHKNKKESK
jgi:hypothetical protein